MLSRRKVVLGLGASAAAAAAAPGKAINRAQGSSPQDWEAANQVARERLLAALPFPRLTVPGAQALSAWREIRRDGEAWPVIIGGDENLDCISEQYGIGDPALYPRTPAVPLPQLRPVEEVLEAATALRYPNGPDRWEGGYQADELTAPVGEWPDDKRLEMEPVLAVAMDALARAPYEVVHILLVPAAAGWQVPAHLRWGGWNACPPPEYHVAALRGLGQRYGAETCRDERGRNRSAARPFPGIPRGSAGSWARTLRLLSGQRGPGNRHPRPACGRADEEPSVELLVGLTSRS